MWRRPCWIREGDDRYNSIPPPLAGGGQGEGEHCCCFITSAMNTLRRLIRDKSALLGLLIIAALLLAAIFAYPLSTHPQDVTSYDPPHRLLPPGATYWFGTDRMGGDIYSRLLFGARLTILIAVIATSVSVLIGVPVGLVAGYYNNRLSDLLMRVSDVFLAVPQIVLAIAIAQTLGPA